MGTWNNIALIWSPTLSQWVWICTIDGCLNYRSHLASNSHVLSLILMFTLTIIWPQTLNAFLTFKARNHCLKLSRARTNVEFTLRKKMRNFQLERWPHKYHYVIEGFWEVCRNDFKQIICRARYNNTVNQLTKMCLLLLVLNLSKLLNLLVVKFVNIFILCKLLSCIRDCKFIIRSMISPFRQLFFLLYCESLSSKDSHSTRLANNL